MSNLYGQDNLQTVVIDDFSPGVMSYGLHSLDPSYSPTSPPGSASFAVRCVNKPGIGLTPFAAYSIPTGSHGVFLPGCFSGSMATLGVYNAGGGAISTYDELLYAGTTANTGANHAWVWPGVGGLLSAVAVPLDFTPAGTTLVTPFFSATRILHTSVDPHIPLPTIFFNYGDTIAWSPTYGLGSSTSNPQVDVLNGGASYANINGYVGLTTYTDRVVAFAEISTANPDYGAGDQIVSNDLIIFTDPPESTSLPDPEQATIFAVEQPQEISAWGSQSTGELFLCFRGAGAVIVSGDIAAPSSAIYLPAVTGTGGIFQQAVSTPIGLVYVTASQGVWAWNGGNSSLKISSSIPDDATIRGDQYSFHALSNNYLFFGNNWIYDCINNSWWQAEDPDVLTFGSFAASSVYGNVMYALPYTLPVTPAEILPYVYDFNSHATSYKWTSNPIPPSAGALASLQYVEICASNPSSTDAFIEVTPTIPPGQTPSPLNQNPNQTQTFTIPPTTSAYRASLPFGYTDHNIEIGIDAFGDPAPVLHSLTLGFSPQRTTTIR